jgi:hypothetical protein
MWTLFPYTTLFRSQRLKVAVNIGYDGNFHHCLPQSVRADGFLFPKCFIPALPLALSSVQKKRLRKKRRHIRPFLYLCDEERFHAGTPINGTTGKQNH